MKPSDNGPDRGKECKMGEEGMEGMQTKVNLCPLSDPAPRPVPRMNGSTSPQRDPEMASVSAVGVFSCVRF